MPHANNERARALGDGQEVPDYGPYAAKDWADPLKGQAAMITRMDRQIGALLAQLKRSGSTSARWSSSPPTTARTRKAGRTIPTSSMPTARSAASSAA